MSSSNSASEHSHDNDNSESPDANLNNVSGEEDALVVNSIVNPYENEPQASVAEDENFLPMEEDEDGIYPRVLAARFEGAVALEKWQGFSI